MAKQPRRSKKRKVVAPSKGDVWLPRFLRQRSLGVMLLALLSAGGGWLVWQSRECLTAQKIQVAATRKAWVKLLTAHQKFGDDTDALITRFDMSRRNQESGYATFESTAQHRRAIFELGQTINADCHAVKIASYEFGMEITELRRLFSLEPTNHSEPEMCESIASAIEKVRFMPEPGNSTLAQYNNFEEDLSGLKKSIESGRAIDRKVNQKVESFLVTLQSTSFPRRALNCLF